MLKLLRQYSNYLLRHKKELSLGLVCLLLTNLFAAAKPMALKFAIEGMERELKWENILLLSLIIVGLAVFQGIFRFFQRKTLIGASRKAEYSMRSDFVAHLQRLPMSYYDRNSTGDIMARATSDVEAVRLAYGPGVMYAVDTAVVTVISLTLMFYLNYKLTFLALTILPIISVLVYFVGKKTYKLHTKAQETFSSLNAFAQENISGVRVVKSFALEDQRLRRFQELSQEYMRRSMALVKVQAIFIPLLYFFMGLGILVIISYGGVSIIKGQMTLGGFAAFIAYLSMLAWPMIALGWVVNLFQRGEASMKRIDRIISNMPEIADHPSPKPFPAQTPGLEFRSLDYSYDGSSGALHNIDLTVEPGSTLGIVGATGSGKSALVKLIPRLYNPPPGRVFIGGIPVEEISLQSLRANIAFVPQDTFLFSSTLKENIDFYNSIKPELLTLVSRTAGLLQDIDGFPRRFDTMVGERGITLSGGQKQRVALARALLKDAPILILDDALTGVDAATEKEILLNLRDEFEGRTVIVVSHRISAVSNLDRIIVMDNGRILEAGTHSELVELKGSYYRLYRRQLLEEELDRI